MSMDEQNRNEIIALLQLVDDPDEEVFDTVANKLLNYGKEIIPQLEHVWETTEDEGVQERIELLIHRVHFLDLQEELIHWVTQDKPDILHGAILVAKYRFPDLSAGSILSQFDKIKKNVWLELNQYLTPLEQVNVLNSILYNYYKFQGHEVSERNPDLFFVNKLLESRQGNAYSIGLLYLAVCESLDIPVFAVDIPRQFMFAYLDILHSFFGGKTEDGQHIIFFVDPVGGMAYTQKEIDLYLKKINATDREEYFKPLNTRRVVYKMLEELSLCYRYKHDDAAADEIQQLMQLIVLTK